MTEFRGFWRYPPLLHFQGSFIFLKTWRGDTHETHELSDNILCIGIASNKNYCLQKTPYTICLQPSKFLLCHYLAS